MRADRPCARCATTYHGTTYYGTTYYAQARRLLLPHQPYCGRYADFYERAILNGIVGNQDRRDPTKGTSYIYMLPLGGAVKKAWGKSDFGFPCCWGTLSES